MALTLSSTTNLLGRGPPSWWRPSPRLARLIVVGVGETDLVDHAGLQAGERVVRPPPAVRTRQGPAVGPVAEVQMSLGQVDGSGSGPDRRSGPWTPAPRWWPNATQDPQNAWSLTGSDEVAAVLAPVHRRRQSDRGLAGAVVVGPGGGPHPGIRAPASRPAGSRPYAPARPSRLKLELAVSPGCHSRPRR